MGGEMVAEPADCGYDDYTADAYTNDDFAELVARAFDLDIVDVRRSLSLWVPDGPEPRPMTPEEAIEADPSFAPFQRRLLLAGMKLIREGVALGDATERADGWQDGILDVLRVAASMFHPDAGDVTRTIDWNIVAADTANTGSPYRAGYADGVRQAASAFLALAAEPA